jgi:hypothetical protein
VITVVAAGALAEALAFGVWVAGRRTASAGLVAKTGGLLFFWFNRVPLVFETRTSPAIGARTSGLVSIAFAPLLGTILVWWLLFVGGRALARDGGDGSLAGAARGALVGVPYAALCLIGSLLVRVRGLPIAAVSSRLPAVSSVRPSLLGALLWPLLFGLVFGAIGGISWPRDPGTPSGAAVRAAVAGGVTMLVAALVLSFAGMLVLAAAKPSTTREYFRGAFDRGPVRGAALLGLQAVVSPNMSAWVLAPAMGACDAVTSSVTAGRGCFLAYWRFPTGRGALGAVGIGGFGSPSGGRAGGRAPPAYLLFVLVPLTSVLVGGARAARWRSGPRTDGAKPTGLGSLATRGAAAGLVFGALAALLFATAEITARVHGSVGAAGGVVGGSIGVTVGPRLGPSVLLALAWGVLGGAIGAAMFRPRERS